MSQSNSFLIFIQKYHMCICMFLGITCSKNLIQEHFSTASYKIFYFKTPTPVSPEHTKSNLQYDEQSSVTTSACIKLEKLIC